MMVDNKQFGTWEEAVVWLRGQQDRRQLVLDAFYDDPLIDAAKRYHASSEWSAVAALLRGRGGRALDVGAGRGIASYALAREGFSVTSLEPDGSPIVGAAAIRGLATTTQLPIDVVENFSEALPFSGATFDVVFARAVLHHTSDLDDACREIYRVLKPGGLFIAAREHVISSSADLDKFLQLHPLHRLYGGENAFLLNRYLDALKRANFVSIEILRPLRSPINLFPYSVVSLKTAIIEKLSHVIPLTPLWRWIFGSDRVFQASLLLAEQFDNRPGRLYSFVARKAPA